MVVKDFSSYLLGIVTGVLFSIAGVCFVELTRKPAVDNNPYEEIIQQQKDSLTAKIRSLETKYVTTDMERTVLRQKVFILEQELIRIKDHAKDINVNSSFITDTECQQFFTDRYKGYE